MSRSGTIKIPFVFSFAEFTYPGLMDFAIFYGREMVTTLPCVGTAAPSGNGSTLFKGSRDQEFAERRDGKDPLPKQHPAVGETILGLAETVFIAETANLTPVFKRAAAGALDWLSFQTKDTNSDSILFVGGSICSEQGRRFRQKKRA